MPLPTEPLLVFLERAAEAMEHVTSALREREAQPGLSERRRLAVIANKMLEASRMLQTLAGPGLDRLDKRVVTARSPQEIRRDRRIERDAEGTETSPRFQQQPRRR